MNPLAAFGRTMDRWPPTAQAATWILFTGLAITLSLAVVRHIADEVHIFEIVFVRSVFGLLLMLPVVLKRGAAAPLRPNRPGLCVLVSVLGMGAATCLYFAAARMPLADITAILFIRPIFVAMIAIVVLGEASHGRRWSAIAVGLAGGLIVVRPGFGTFDYAILFVLGTVAIQSWNPINRKLLSRSDHPDTIALWMPLVVIPVAGVASIFVWTTPTWEQLGWMLVIGVLETLTQRGLARSYLKGDATIVVALTFTRLPIAALVGFALFGDVPQLWVWVGGLVIVVAAGYLTRGEAVDERRAGYGSGPRPG
jgi:drug/metabolite transporter (DMT)-like permease